MHSGASCGALAYNVKYKRANRIQTGFGSSADLFKWTKYQDSKMIVVQPVKLFLFVTVIVSIVFFQGDVTDVFRLSAAVIEWIEN